jgi:copper resistance protein D
MEEALYACRFIQFTAAIVIFGAVAFQHYAIAGGAKPASSSVAVFDAWVSQVTLAAAIAALVSGLAFLLCQSAAMSASPAAALDPAALSAILFETRFGRVWSGHLVIALILVLACLGRSRRRPWAILILSLLLLASLAWIGHAAIEEGAAGIARELNQTVHLLAAGLWLGGLVPLGWLVRRVQTTQDDAGVTLARDAIRHFSQMGYAAVGLIALTGAINSLLLVGSLDGMVGTPYGRLLSFKILLFLVMVLAALVNRFRLVPRISSDPASLGVLCRTVGLEQALGLAILAVVSILGTWPPAVHGGGE